MVSKQQFFLVQMKSLYGRIYAQNRSQSLQTLFNFYLPLNNKSFRENGSKCETEDTTSWAPQAMIGYLDTRRSRCQSPEDHWQGKLVRNK